MTEHIQFETNGVTVLAIPLKENEKPHSVEDGRLYYSYISSENGSEQLDFRNIPDGPWSIHAVTPDITEEQAKVLFEQDKDKGLFKCHELKGNLFLFYYALTSITGLLRSHGIDPKKKNVLLIKEKP